MTLQHHRVLTDREPLRLPESSVTGEGYINLSARIARIGIQSYYGHELQGVDNAEPEKLYRVYRPVEEVFAVDTLASFTELPITLGHPPVEIGAENYKNYAVGHIIGTPVRDGDYVRAELSVRDAAAIAKIKSGEAAELSVGYHAEVRLEAGLTPAGEAYDAIQSHIRGNHIALVDAARCGPECRIGDRASARCDCASCQSIKEQIMTDFVTIDGEPMPLAEAVDKLRDANTRMAEALKDAETTIESLSSELETKTGEVEAMKQTPTGDSDFAAKVRARAQMLSEASAVLGANAQISTLPDADIRRRVINRIYGDGFAEGASDHALIGMYKVAVRDAAKNTDNLNGLVAPGSSTSTHLQAALTRRNERLTHAWKGNA